MTSVQAVSPPPSQLHRVANGIVEAGWLAAVVLVPLVVNPWGFNYELPKVTLFRGLMLLMATAHLLMYVVGGDSGRRNWAQGSPPTGASIEIGHWLSRPLVRPILLVAGVVLLSTLTSLSPLVSLWGSYHRQQGAYLLISFILWALLLAAHLHTPAQRRRLLSAIVVAGSLVALTPFIEVLCRQDVSLTRRPNGTLGNPIFLGAYLIMVVPFTLTKVGQCLAGQEHVHPTEIHPLPRTSLTFARVFAWSVALALQLFALLITQSRGPWVGALVGVALFAALVLWPTHRRLVLVGLVAEGLLIGGLVTGLNFGLVSSAHLSRLPYVRRVVLPQGLQTGTVRVRLVLWQAAGKVVTTWPEVGLEPDRLHGLRPVVGYGPDTAVIVYTAAYPPELAHIEDPSAIWDRAHNGTLDLLAMQGWLGLIALAVLGVACTRRGQALWRATAGPVERAWVAAPLAALAAHVVETQFAFSVTATGMMAWLCVALLASEEIEANPTRSQIRSWKISPESDSGVLRRLSQPVTRWRVYAALGALLLVLVAVRLEGGAAWADMLVAHARALDRAGRWGESIELYNRALVIIPWQGTYHQFRAEAFYNLARALPEDQVDLRVQLLEATDRSLAHARRSEPLELEHYSNAGIVHATWGEVVNPAHLKTAVAFYQQAFRLAPSRADLRTDLGHIYHNYNHYEKALAQYRAALEIDPLFAAAHYDSGLAWLALGQKDSARQAFQATLDLVPDCDACRDALQALEE
ncbi:MAG: O-antigen ligase family protein [Chloroflexota bacterium]|nr:O-antigen ligase family protein [Chloroflexota bacterium]